MFNFKFNQITGCYRGVIKKIKMASIFPSQTVSFCQSVKFDVRYGFKIFDENFLDLKLMATMGQEYSDKDPLFLFPGFEGKLKFVQELICNLKRPVHCFQYPFEKSPTNVTSIAENIIPLLKNYIKPNHRVNIVAHSFGGLVALSVLKELQPKNQVRLCLIDSSPYAIKFMTAASFGDYQNDKKQVENELLTGVLRWMNIKNSQMFVEIFDEPENWNMKLKKFVQNLPSHPKFSKRDLQLRIDAFYRIIQAIFSFNENMGKLDAKTSLIRSTEKILPFPDDFREAEYFTQPTRTLFTEGNHFNILKFPKTADIINQELKY